MNKVIKFYSEIDEPFAKRIIGIYNMFLELFPKDLAFEMLKNEILDSHHELYFAISPIDIKDVADCKEIAKEEQRSYTNKKYDIVIKILKLQLDKINIPAFVNEITNINIFKITEIDDKKVFEDICVLNDVSDKLCLFSKNNNPNGDIENSCSGLIRILNFKQFILLTEMQNNENDVDDFVISSWKMF